MMEYLSQDSLASAGSPLSTILKTTLNDETSRWRIMTKFNSHQGSSNFSLFSSSLPVLPHEKFILDSDNKARSIDDTSSKLDDLQKHLDVKDSIEVFDLQGIGSLLPDEDELFDSIMSGYNQTGLSNLEQAEDCEIFSCGGGIELDTDSFIMERANTDSYVGNDSFQCNINGVGSIGGEHPYGEHPSRTLFVRNINSNVEDAELRSLFEQYGDIRSMYTHCKHRGFVMISYYDIRHARKAMRALQNKPLRRRKLDIHFSIPKDNPSDKDLNQGTLVVFNLDPSISNDVLRQIFGAFGEVKEIRETPNKKHHKFVEFYDVRAAEDALRSLNKSDIAGKRIKLEPSRPGGARRNFMHPLSQDIDSDEINCYKHQVGSPLTSSPPGAWVQFSSSIDNAPLSAISISPLLGTGSPVSIGRSPELTSVLHPMSSNSSNISSISKEHYIINQAEPFLSNNSPRQGSPFLQSQLLSEQGGGSMPNLSFSSVSTASFAPLNSRTPRMETLTVPQFLWGSPKSHLEHQPSSLSMTSLGNAFTSDGQRRIFARSYLSDHGSLLAASCQHVGSAPSGIPFENNPSFLYDLPDSSFVNTASVWSMGISQNADTIMPNSGFLSKPINQGSSFSGTFSPIASPEFRMISSSMKEPVFVGNPSYTGHVSIGMEGHADRGWIRQADKGRSLPDGKNLFHLDIEKIISGEDTRTTLMIKNIPNKYTCKMLLSSIDENHRGFYDFLYLPIDFKNKCNVGYAFINMVSSSHIISFHKAFSGRRWEKFNSEKVASLAYARIQGKVALVAHFQNSSLMNEDKRCRPILFDSGISEKPYSEELPKSLLVSKLQVNGSVSATEFAEDSV